jgi:hypothetical protein
MIFIRRIIRTMIEINHPIIKQELNLNPQFNDLKFVNGMDRECELVNILEYIWEDEEEHF